MLKILLRPTGKQQTVGLGEWVGVLTVSKNYTDQLNRDYEFGFGLLISIFVQ